MIVLLLCSLSSAADEPQPTKRVYQWTDAQGQVQLSDQPPPGGPEAAEVHEVAPGNSASGPAAAPSNPFSVENQARAMEAERQARTAERQSKREQALRERKLRAEVQEAEARAKRESDAANTSETERRYDYGYIYGPGYGRCGNGRCSGGRCGRPPGNGPVRPTPLPTPSMPSTHINSPVGAGARARSGR